MTRFQKTNFEDRKDLSGKILFPPLLNEQEELIEVISNSENIDDRAKLELLQIELCPEPSMYFLSTLAESIIASVSNPYLSS